MPESPAQPLPETSNDPAVIERMRADWDARAREDANYYVAFGRRDQDGEEFESTAVDVVPGLERELLRLPASLPRAQRRALEIGCGPGRLMKPLSPHFGEIHGVDISAEMVQRARQRLASIPYAHAHVALRSNLEMFAARSFHFIYSYAVFQHIPSREVVTGYWAEAARTLAPGGIFRFQCSGLPPAAADSDTWSGVRFTAADLRQAASLLGLQLLALEGVGTQYMWATLRRPDPAWQSPPDPCTIRRITNAETSEPFAPASGRYAALSLWVEALPWQADLNSLSVLIGGQPAVLTYLGPRSPDALFQINARLPQGLPTGLLPIQLMLGEQPLSPPFWFRIVPPPPPVPRLISLTDGINLLSETEITSGSIKVMLEEIGDPAQVHFSLDHLPTQPLDWLCIDPVPPRHEFNLLIPEGYPGGETEIRIHAAGRILGPLRVRITPKG